MKSEKISQKNKTLQIVLLVDEMLNFTEESNYYCVLKFVSDMNLDDCNQALYSQRGIHFQSCPISNDECSKKPTRLMTWQLHNVTTHVYRI